MRIVPYQDIDKAQWNAFCDGHEAAWFWHTSMWIDYLCARGEGQQNLSFAVMDGEEIVGICPLILEDGEFQAQDMPIPASLCLKDRSMAVQEISHMWMSNLFAQHNVSRTRTMWSPLAGSPSSEYMQSISHRVVDISWQSRVIDLTQWEWQLWRGVSSKYKAPIKAQQKKYHICFFNTQVGTEELPAFHAALEGKEARSKERWKMMGRWLNSGNAMIVQARSPYQQPPTRLLAYAYFIIYKKKAYWMSGKRMPGENLHAVIWEAMRELKLLGSAGADLLEMGWQGLATDEKGKNVERFKRRFGGEDRTVVAVERRYG